MSTPEFARLAQDLVRTARRCQWCDRIATVIEVDAWKNDGGTYFCEKHADYYLDDADEDVALQPFESGRHALRVAFAYGIEVPR